MTCIDATPWGPREVFPSGYPPTPPETISLAARMNGFNVVCIVSCAWRFTVGRVVGVDLQILDVRQTPLVHSAVRVLFQIDALVVSRVNGQLGELVFHVIRAHAPPQIGQRLLRVGRPVPGQQPHWRLGCLRENAICT